MGVADNKSYKDQYHFKNEGSFRIRIEDLPSLNVPPKINTTIKENPYKSNVEIEGKELVLKPDLSALHKAVGKRHSQGGMDVYLEPDSFVFSNDKTLAFSKGDNKELELKEGGSVMKNTPAQMVKRNVDVKHYNTLVNNTLDPKKDELAKKSSARMLDKYIKTLGVIAFKQEEKKDFPTGIPSFSEAPVYDADLKDQIMETKQYAKYGGTMQKGGRKMPSNGFTKYDPVTGLWYADNTTPAPPAPKTANPYIPQDQWGPWQGDKLPVFSKQFGVSNAADKITNLDFLSKELGYTGPRSNVAFQKWLYNSSPENKAVIDKWHTKYGEPNIGKPNDQRNRFDDKIGIRWTNAINEILQKTPNIKVPDMTSFSTPDETPVKNSLTPNPNQDPNLKVPNVTGTPQDGIDINWQFTPEQRLSQTYNLGKLASAKRYMPYRSKYNAAYIDPALLNPEQSVADAQSVTNQQLKSLSTLSPILRNAQAAQAYGTLIDKIPSIRNQYDNQNAQILNQTRQANVQIRNNETGQNMQNDQNYYRESVIGQQNFDNMKNYLADQYMNNRSRDVEANQTLAYNEAQLNNPAYRFDFRSGDLKRNPKNILDVTSNTKSDLYTQLATTLSQKIQNGEKLSREEVEFFKGLSLGKIPFSPGNNKKGGRILPNPYK